MRLSPASALPGLLSLGDQPVTYQCHHHSLFLDRTVLDALGGEGWAICKQAAESAARALIAAACAERGAHAPGDRLGLSARLFAAMGQGRLRFDVTAEGGTVTAAGLHHGAEHARKYGHTIRSRTPVDAFAAGYVAAAASLAFPSDWGLFDAEETSCVARRDERCVFAVARTPARARRRPPPTRAAAEAIASEAEEPRAGDAIAESAELSMARLLRELDAGEAGRIEAFGVSLALVPVGYLDSITFDTMHLVERRSPEVRTVLAALAREAAALGGFHLLGGITASPLWQAEMGGAARDPERLVHELSGIAGALGWGKHTVTELRAGQRLVVRSHATHESVYYAARHGASFEPRLVFLQGTALAMMLLAERARLGEHGPIEPGTYASLLSRGERFRVEETRSTLWGDAACEVVVEATG